MTKKIVAVVLTLVMMFACAMPAFAATLLTRDEAAIAGAKAKYLALDGKSSDDADYNAFKITRCVLNNDDEDNTYYEVTVRSNYVWKYTCKVSYVGLAGVGTYVYEDGNLVATNQIEGIFGYVVDTILQMIYDLIN